MLTGLKLARDDERVKALVVKVGGLLIGLAVVQELREAVQRLGEALQADVRLGRDVRPVLAGNLPYYLATAFETVYMQPSGDLGLTLASRWSGCSCAARWTSSASLWRSGPGTRARARPSSSPRPGSPRRPARRRSPADGPRPVAAEQLADAIAARASSTREDAMKLLTGGPYSAEQGVETGLIDSLSVYRDQVYSVVRKRVKADQDTVLLFVGRYQRFKELRERFRQLPTPKRQDAVALITATGEIRRGRNGRGSPLGGGTAMGSDSITR